MSSESYQNRLDRVRRPRVHIKYEVEDLGMPVKIDLPFVVGIMADLSGQRKEPLPEFTDPRRKFTEIDRDNFNEVLKGAAPRLTYTVDNKLSDAGGKLPVELKFEHIDDFEPANVARQVEPLRELLELRESLKQLQSRMEGKAKFVKLLEEVFTSTEKRAAVAKELGIDLSGAKPEEGSK